MAEVGDIIAGKYEILKEIGHGGMSVVYLANDTHLNRNWAVKEVSKKQRGKKDEIVVNSLLAEANMVKKLDHPALPRIVDIIEDRDTINIVMDFIEGESLDNVIKESGPQPEEKVIEWAMQVCDVLSYLHSQKPPIVYRDMKPSNLMLKPNGNISIIDFGIAREYKETKLEDTTVLGTKGYAPPEQHSGKTDPRSDIFALGMTMHHLLTGVDPRKGFAYAPVRAYNPSISEGLDAIINRCVEPAPENRYQNCTELPFDLQDPDKVTRQWKKQLKRKLSGFVVCASVACVALFAGIGFMLASNYVNNQDYDSKLNSLDPNGYFQACDIYPNRVDAYEKLIEYCKNNLPGNDFIVRVGNEVEKNSTSLNNDNPEIAKLQYDIGKLYFSEYDGTLKQRASNAKMYFENASESNADFEKKDLAKCYYSMCKFLTTQDTTTEHGIDDYTSLMDEIKASISSVDKLGDGEANYDKISFYYSVLLLINDQSKYMASLGFDKDLCDELMQKCYDKSIKIVSSLTYVSQIQSVIESDYSNFKSNLDSSFNEFNKVRNGDK